MSGLDHLIAGYRRFRAGHWSQERARWAELAEAQHPATLVIACSDSRVDPTRIFDTSPGEMFVVRNVANLVPPFETGGGFHGVSAAVEFAVTRLEVSSIVVIGHGGCGGAAAALNRSLDGAAPGEGGFVADWIRLLDPARDQVTAQFGTGAEATRALEMAGVKLSLANLRSFPFVAAREQDGTLRLHGAYFAIADGVLHLLDAQEQQFRPVNEA